MNTILNETLTDINWHSRAQAVLDGQPLTRDEALALLQTPDDDILSLLDAAFVLRRHYYGKKVKLNMLMNAKSGHCPEDCDTADQCGNGMVR